ENAPPNGTTNSASAGNCVIEAIRISKATVAKPLTAVFGSAEDHLMVEAAGSESGDAFSNCADPRSSSICDSCEEIGVATLIWGAPHCGQNGVPGVTSALHRWQRLSIGEQFSNYRRAAI